MLVALAVHTAMLVSQRSQCYVCPVPSGAAVVAKCVLTKILAAVACAKPTVVPQLRYIVANIDCSSLAAGLSDSKVVPSYCPNHLGPRAGSGGGTSGQISTR